VLRDITALILETVFGLLGSTLLLRAYLGWLRVPRSNPLTQFCVSLTDWMVMPMRRIVTNPGRLDLVSLFAAAIMALLEDLVAVVIGAAIAPHAGLVLIGVALILCRWTLHLMLFLLIVNAVLSLVNPYAPLAPVFDVLTRPWLAPLRRRMPKTGAIDLSPMVAALVIMIVLSILDRFPA
jgi:YggT family protein